MEEIKETKEFAKQWIEEGKPCVYRSGWGWKGQTRKLVKD